MELTLIQLCEESLKSDSTGQHRAFLIAKLEGSKEAYIKAADRLSGQVKSLEASARELSIFIELLEKKNES